jgi:cell division protease FtsH
MNKIMVGWQPMELEYSKESIHKIAIHEMGHAIIGHLSVFHPNVTKITINLFSPKSPGYTVFENSLASLYTQENLFNHLQVLLAGRIAEEIFFNVSVTTGAINDLAEAFHLAEKMIVFYGMGSNLIYPSKSDKYKEMIDNETFILIERAYTTAKEILLRYKKEILFGAQLLENHRNLNADDLEYILGLHS